MVWSTEKVNAYVRSSRCIKSEIRRIQDLLILQTKYPLKNKQEDIERRINYNLLFSGLLREKERKEEESGNDTDDELFYGDLRIKNESAKN